MWGKRIMPPGYDGLQQDNPYRAPQNQAQQPPQNPPPNSQWNQSPQGANTTQNLNTGNSSQSSGTGLSDADWAALMAIAREYFGKDNKVKFKDVPLSPEQRELYRRSLGYLDNSPTRNYLMPQIDQRLRALGASQFNMPATIGARGLPDGIAGQTFYQPTANRNAPGGTVPPLGPLVTAPEEPGAPPVPRNPDDPRPGENDVPRNQGRPTMLEDTLNDFFNRLNQNQLDQYMSLAAQDPQTASAIEQAGGFQSWLSSLWNQLVEYARQNPGNVSGLLATLGTLAKGPIGALFGRLLGAAINRALRQGGRDAAPDRPGGAPDGRPGDGGGPPGGYGSDVGPGANTGGRPPGAYPGPTPEPTPSFGYEGEFDYGDGRKSPFQF